MSLKMEKTKVLIVEDTTIALISALLVLQKFHLDIDIAKTGADATALASEKKYNLILLDLGLPDMSGAEVVNQLRNSPHNATAPEVAIIAVTAYSKEQYKEQLDDLAVDGFLTKPLQYDTLKDKLNSLCSVTHDQDIL